MQGYGSFWHELGALVQLAHCAPVRTVVWRGYLLLGPPGARLRVPVYQLNNEHWDCYYEDELRSLNA